MADYKLTQTGVLRRSDNLSIVEMLIDPNWVEYLQWLDAGNTPDPMYDTKGSAMDFRLGELQALFFQKSNGTMVYLGNTFSLTGINKVVKDKSADKTKTFNIPTVDNQIIPFSKTEYKGFGDAMVDAIDDIEDQDIVHRSGLQTLYDDVGATAEDILNYDITIGW